MRLDLALRAWGTPQFEAVLKQALQQQPESLPLQQGLSQSSSVADTPITAVIRSVSDLGDTLRVRVGILYQGVVGGCSCTDDPTPDREINEHCDMQLDIDKATAATAVTLLAEDQSPV